MNLKQWLTTLGAILGLISVCIGGTTKVLDLKYVQKADVGTSVVRQGEFIEHKQDVQRALDKQDQKMDRLGDKIDRILEKVSK